MKKILALLLAGIIALSTFVACGIEDKSKENDDESKKSSSESETAAGEISQEQWKAAIAPQSFENVTINYSFDDGANPANHVVKITKEEVFRQVTMNSNGAPETMKMVYTGEDATQQRDLFLSILLALMAEKDNFVWDKETNAYVIAKDEVKVDIPDYMEVLSLTETMKDGIVKFNANGKLEHFECTLTEAVYQNNESIAETTGKVIWSFADYGTTLITDGDRAQESESDTD